MIDDNDNNKSKNASIRLRTKSVGRPRKVKEDGNNQTLDKNQSKQRTKSMMVTRNRRK